MEPTSALTFEDLILEAARLMGVGHYGEGGDEALQVPTDPHDLAECKRHVNNAIRMFIADAPRTGWRWMRPIARMTLDDADSLPENENGVIEANYDMPIGFAGQFNGSITVIAGTNQAWEVEWTNEARIRQLRENQSFHIGHPRLVAVRVKEDRRTWELLVWPAPHIETTIEFPFDVHFDRLEELDEKPPIPFSFDEALKAATLAVVERDVHDLFDRHWQYYREVALPNAHQIDARSAPRRLGYFGNPERPSPMNLRTFREISQRPVVGFTKG